MNTGIITSVQDVKFPFGRKILFSLSGFSRMLASAMISTYAVYYYTDILGLSGALVGIIILISKIWDIINDPMMGILVDRTRSKEGKCRYWLKFFSVPGGIVLAMMFIVPDFGTTGQAVWFAVTYIFQAMFHTVLRIPANALIGRITSNQSERSKINQIFMIFNLAGTYSLTAAAMPLVKLFGGEDLRKGFVGLAIVCGVLYALGFLAAALATKGYEPLEYLEEEHLSQKKGSASKTSLKETLLALLRNNYWLLCVGVAFFSVLGEGTSLASLVQHFQYNLGDMGLMTTYSVISVITTVIGILSLGILTKKLGNAGTAFLAGVLGFAGWMLRFVFSDASATVFIVGFIIGAAGSGLVSAVIILCLLDSCVYGHWKTGVDNDAILMSGHTTASKVGFAIGPSIGAMLLDVVNYVPQAAEQSETVKNLFLIENTLVPALGYGLVAVCAFFMLRLEKKLPQIKAELEARAFNKTEE